MILHSRFCGVRVLESRKAFGVRIWCIPGLRGEALGSRRARGLGFRVSMATATYDLEGFCRLLPISKVLVYRFWGCRYELGLAAQALGV